MPGLLLALLLSANAALPPVLSPPGATYASAVTVQVRPLSSGSIVRCTTDDTPPTLTSARYMAPFSVPSTGKVRCKAWVQGKRSSPEASATYVIDPTVASTCPTNMGTRTGTTTYYCDCAAGAASGCSAYQGSDTAPGDGTIAHPYRSFGAAIARFRTMPAGSTVALCRGGAWAGATMQGNMDEIGQGLRNLNCTEESPCDFRDYEVPGWGATAKPLLRPGGPGLIFSIGGSQYYSGGAGWSMTHSKGYRFYNLDLFADTAGTTKAFRIFGAHDGTEICGNIIRGVGNSLGFDGAIDTMTSTTVNRINFHHNRVTDNIFGIGTIGGGVDTGYYIDSNYLDHNGGNTNRDHTLYIGGSPAQQGPRWAATCGSWTGGAGNPNPEECFCSNESGVTQCYLFMRDTRITNNEVRRAAWGATTACGGTMLVAHTPFDTFLVENNLFVAGDTTGSCYGIGIDWGLDMPQATKNLTIRRNQVWGADTGISVDKCRDCVIEDNLIVDTNGIQFPNRGYCPSYGAVNPEGGTCNRNDIPGGTTRGIVRNNTIISGGTTIGITPRGTSEGTGHVWANNIVITSLGGSLTLGSGVSVNTGNLVQSTNGTLFVNPTTTEPLTSPYPDYTLQPSQPRGGSATYMSPTSIGTIPWSPTDSGKARSPTSPDRGAYER